MSVVLGALLGAVATAVVGPLMAARAEVRRHDRQVAERDGDLEEWLVIRHRDLRRRWHHIELEGLDSDERGARRVAAQTELLYEPRTAAGR